MTLPYKIEVVEEEGVISVRPDYTIKDLGEPQTTKSEEGLEFKIEASGEETNLQEED
jgi:hypothetical protein